MLKKTFYLFSVSLLFFGATSCGPNDKNCQNMNLPIKWEKKVANFKTIRFYIADDYYNYSNQNNQDYLVVGPNKAIRNFYDVFLFSAHSYHPGLEGNSQHLTMATRTNSKIKVITTIDSDCIKKPSENGKEIKDYIYYTPAPTYVVDGYMMSMSFSNHGEGGFVSLWHSNRGDLKHTYEIDITSGPYKGEDGDLYDLRWFWVGDRNNLNRNNLQIIGDNEVAINSLAVQGAAINRSIHKPFVKYLYMNGIMSERTFENVAVANNQLALTVK